MKAKLLLPILLLASTGAVRAQIPDSPVLTEPPNLNTVTASVVELQWGSVSNALWYMVEVSTDQNFIGSSVVNDVSYSNYYVIPLGVLTPNTTYYWRAMSCNLSGTSPWSAVWSFTTAANAMQECSVLENDIDDLVPYGLISSSNADWLNSKFDDAMERLEHGNTEAAINNINAFENRVNALVHNRHINAETGEELNERGDYIIAVIRNSTSPILEGEPVKNYALNQNYPNPFNPE